MELSEWSHVELVLYATGLERDRKQLITLMQLVKRELASLHQHNDMPANAATTIEQLLTTLNNHPLMQ